MELYQILDRKDIPSDVKQALKDLITKIKNDITDRKKAEEKLKLMTDYLEKLHNTLGDAIFTVKLPERLVESTNHSVEKIFGFSPDECINKSTSIFYPNEKGYRDFGNKLREVIQQDQSLMRTEHLLKRRNGEVFPSEITTSFFREKDITTRVISIVRDISERKIADEKMKQYSEQLEEIVEMRTHDLGERVKELTCLYGLSKLTSNLERSIDEIASQTIEIIPPAWQYPEITCARITLEGTTHTTDTFQETPWKQTADIQVSGRKFGFVEVYYVEERPFLEEERDLIDAIARELGKFVKRKKIEQIREDLVKRRDNFIWMTSHELRTPLTIIGGYCDFLLAHSDEFSQKRITNILSTMRSNLDRLDRLTSQVSTVVQIERGIFKMEKSDINLGKFLQDIIKNYQVLLGEQLELQGCPTDPPIIIEGDPNRLQQVLDNIIGNAIQQTHKEKRRIKVLSKIHPNHVTIAVSDNGAGISPTDLETIFEQFVTIPTEFASTGTGIGLYLCRKILETHNGIITAQSQGVGQGATFTIELPRKYQ